MRFKTLANFALASAAALLLSGCADDSPRQLYYWDGAYTSSVYEYLTEEGDAGAQIAALEESLQKAYKRAAKARTTRASRPALSLARKRGEI